MKSIDTSRPLKLSESIERLVEIWNDWMLGNSIALDPNNCYVIKGVAARLCEKYIKQRYNTIEDIDETFEQSFTRAANQKPNG